MIKLNLKRLRYLLPALLAVLCVLRALTLTAAMERGQQEAQNAANALRQVHEAAELVSELRVPGSKTEWVRARRSLQVLGRDPEFGGTQLRRLVELTEALFEPGANPPDRHTVWLGWRELEAAMSSRLAADLTRQTDFSAPVALLAMFGCVACAGLIWQAWHAGRLRDDASLLETRYRDGEARWRAMTDSAREVLIQADPTGRILRSNHKLHTTDMTWLFDTPETWQKVQEELKEASSGPLPPREVWLGGEGDGTLVEWHVFPVTDGGGRLVRVDSALLDITTWYAGRQGAQARATELEEKMAKLEQQLRDLLEQSFELAESRDALKKAGEARMESLLNWGRRVAQPLEEATSRASRLRSEVNAPKREDAVALAGAVDAVAASLRALADFAGLERGPLELAPSRMSLRGLVEDAMEAAAQRAEVRNLEMPCILHQDVPEEVIADSGRLAETLGLVIEHAVDHTGCGEVCVRVSLAGRAGALANIRFEVEDTGAGFAPEELATAFEPFHPGLAPTEVASRLAFAKRMVEKMGGQFGAESEPGQGTRVWFLVPAEVPGQASPDVAPEPDELAGRRILVVDDAASQRGALLELAQSIGLEAQACSSAADTILQLRRAAATGVAFDFVLVDDEVSGVRGASLAAQIVEDPSLGAPSVLVAVPYSLRSTVKDPRPAGVRGMIPKPIRRSALRDLLLGEAPVARAEPVAPLRLERTAGPTPAGSPSVLIVEDNLVNQRVAVRLVEKMGYRTAVVGNGREAIQAFLKDPFDLILMDCQMPEVDGFTATAEIRRLEPPGSRVPVIAMTANAMRGDRERCIAAGMDDYISKPVAFEDLRVLVTRWLARTEAARH